MITIASLTKSRISSKIPSEHDMRDCLDYISWKAKIYLIVYGTIPFLNKASAERNWVLAYMHSLFSASWL